MHSPSCRNQNSAIGIFLCQLVSAFPGPGRHPSIFRPIGSWRAPSLRQMRLLRQTYFAFLRKLLRLGPEAHVSNQTALVKTNTADVRIFLALDRLRYARKVFQISSEITQNRVHLEFAKCQALGFMVYLRILCGQAKCFQMQSRILRSFRKRISHP